MFRVTATIVLAQASVGVAGADGGGVDFNRDIRPILSANCFACHGPDASSRKADLRLDTGDGARAALTPADDSELIYRIDTGDPDDQMPPPDSGHSLTGEQRDLLRAWVAAGAPYDVPWAFEPPRQEPVPDGVHPVDHFVQRRLAEAGLAHSPRAERYTLIRRLSLDLTGLPPTPEEADDFVADGDYAKAVDRLLASPAFGERWARVWLDLARFADTKGYEKDRPRPMWRYRDWVIDALNRDMPFDQFTAAQLAGDLLPDATADQILATAFHRNTMENDEGGTDDEEFRIAAVKDRVDTTMQVWMGLTMGCAKCHSHKYDPLTIEDYYSMYAFFNQTEDADRGTPTVPTPTAAQQREITSLEARGDALREQLGGPPPGFAEALREWRDELEERPLWQPLRLVRAESAAGLAISQRADGTLHAAGELPAEDTWTLTFEAPASGGGLTALRLDTLPKPPGGKWEDKNVVLNELDVAWLPSGASELPLRLTNARADFSQRRWEVGKAVDGDPATGWAFSPKAAEPHVAVFDLAGTSEGGRGRLRVTLAQRYGEGLVFRTLRISGSSHPTDWLGPEVDPAAALERIFSEKVFAPTRELHAELAAVERDLAAVRAKVPQTPVMRELPPERQRATHVHRRGNFLDPGDRVTARLPSVFGSLPEGAPADRRGVAQWLTGPDNPLTARVMVNRVWARLFGTGIVETEEDFGAQGTPPSHPQLLDWLAVDYRDNGWSLKHLMRRIVTSHTYQQRAAGTPELLAADPRNRLLGRGARFRLSAEMIRDQALAASGLLTRSVGGPSVMPPQPPGIWKSTYSGEKWRNATGADRYRRGLYTYLKRTSPHPAMTAFDAGSGEVCLVRRVRTNTPLQALVTLNDPAFLEAAGALSERMGGDIARGFRLVLTRPPTEAELQRLERLHAELRADFERDPDAAAQLLASAGLTAGDAAMVAVANVLLNLDETLMKP